MIDAALIQACAPTVAVETVQAIVQVESQGDPIALASNRRGGAVRLNPADLADAIRLARAEIAAGNSVDMGLMQVNSKNLRKLGLTVEQVWEPCTNLRAGAQILEAAYVGAVKEFGGGQAALRAALSAYNTGDFVAGLNNGYVARYYGPARRSEVPSFSTAEIYAADPTIYTREKEPPTMNAHPVVTTDYNEFLTKGVQVELDPAQAEALGVVEETALSEADAWDSQADESAMHPEHNVEAAREHAKARADAEQAFEHAVEAHGKLHLVGGSTDGR